MIKLANRALIGTAVTLLSANPLRAGPQLDPAVYDRAAMFLPDNARHFVLNAAIVPHWRLSEHERLTYRRDLGNGRAEFIEVDAASGRHRAAFNAQLVAQGLSRATGSPVAADQLPFQDFEDAGRGQIKVSVAGKDYACSVISASCRELPFLPPDPASTPSPDGKWLAYLQDGNLWIRSRDGSTRFALTTDAEPHYGYAVGTDMSRGIAYTGSAGRALAVANGRPLSGPPGPPPAAEVIWSPDSKRLFTHRLDERNVADLTLVQSVPTDGTLRPIANSWKYAYPNDPHLPMSEAWIFDIESRSGRRINMEPVPVPFSTAVEAHEAWWANASKLFLLTRTRYLKSMTLHEVDPATGNARAVITESSKTFIEPASLGEKPMVYTLLDGTIVWFSERTGYGHLYLYGASGKLLRPLTQGPWTVRNVLRVDENQGFIYVAGNEREPGEDPYFRRVYRIRLSDGDTRLLTPESADHAVVNAQEYASSDFAAEDTRAAAQNLGFSPSAHYFVDTYSRTDLPPVTVLRSSDGRLVGEIEHADISRLKSIGYAQPERFKTLAADGKTPLYGNILRPLAFDASKKYPVIDCPYPGPQMNRVRPTFVASVFDRGMANAIAELGFVVVIMDGRGTWGRSKAFKDESYSALGQAGQLDDHIAAIRELAKRYPYMDLDRVGIYGTSAGGYATAHAILAYPDFFKVAVSDAGNHEQRSQYAIWGESYLGPESGSNYTDASNLPLANRLKGKLLLLQGDMDSNVFPSQMLLLVDALIKANKYFDMLIVPNDGHGTLLHRGYAVRRAWDYFIVNLLGASPPQDYSFKPAGIN